MVLDSAVNLGVMLRSAQDGVNKSDLVLSTPIHPPVAKIIDFGQFHQQEKEERLKQAHAHDGSKGYQTFLTHLTI